ncbi:MAG: protein kinase [Pirellulales bacterium]
MEDTSLPNQPTQRQEPPPVSLEPVPLSQVLRPAVQVVTTTGSGRGASMVGQQIGRYAVERKLGEGGFGVVYQAHDVELDRRVAVKLPHFSRMRSDQDRRMYLIEARLLAQLDHSAIVPVYDFGVIPDGRCFVVSKFIEGKDLARLLASERPEMPRVAEILATVADALHHVHAARLIHRDIKPSNLLVGVDGRVYVADFGLAMRESMLEPGSETAGTPSYMSPEQARGEGHLMDGRSDQFSLGCVMYELLTGKRAFAGQHTRETLELILGFEPPAPRELNPHVPRELNRICLKLLSKRAADRYTRTAQLAEDLRHWLTAEIHGGEGGAATESLAVSPLPPLDSAAHRGVVPRGLRSFSRDDASFFLSLLPGATDRDGVPMSLRHWRQWIESRDETSDRQRIGVIAGPTGSGKSSLVRAGLLPLLDPRVATTVIEATPTGVERQLSAALDRLATEPLDGSLAERLAAIRLGRGLPESRTLLVVIDQFEQWLNVSPDPASTELVRALRQCDGVRVRCLVLVRDDFWLALHRFLEAVDCPLTLGQNAMMVDLFEYEHARKVLIEFGRGYGRLPPDTAPLSREHERFLDQALVNLAVGDKFIPVQLALFADLVKSREWTPATLRQLGGAVGVGEQFLHESFSAAWAPVHQRAHEQAARKVLEALLPDEGSALKASGRSRADLMLASGYREEPRHFEALMNVLERDLKLISAAESSDRSRSSASSESLDFVTYQLSHDFLVPSVRSWLSAKRRETYRGRLAERLTEQARLWAQRREPRFLPNLLEWAMARTLFRADQLGALEREMLASRDRRSLTSLVAAFLIGLGVFLSFREYRLHTQSAALVAQLQTSDLAQAPAIIDQLAPLERVAGPNVDASLVAQPRGTSAWVALQMTALRWGRQGVDELFQATLDGPPDHLAVQRDALAAHREILTPRCWELLDEADRNGTGRSEVLARRAFRAAQLLAGFDPPNPDDAAATQRWRKHRDFVAQHLILDCRQKPDQFAALAQSLQPAASELLPPLSRSLGAAESVETQLATALLAHYVEGNPANRTRLALDSAPWQWELMLPAQAPLDRTVLYETARRDADGAATAEMRVAAARRQALAAALLIGQLDLNDDDGLWRLLRRQPTPESRTSLIHFLARRNVPWSRLAARLRRESDPGIVSSLLMALGEYPAPPLEQRTGVLQFVRELFERDPDAGVHSAAEWLLGKWGDAQALSTESAATLPVGDPEELRVGPRKPRTWVQSPAGHTLVRVDMLLAPQQTHAFLIATKEVTVEQYLKFRQEKYINRDYSPTDDCPANAMSWPDALAYCNWLSQQEGIPESQWCYPPDSPMIAEWTPTPEHTQRLGYRLPLRVEWEFACRAGTTSERYCGDDLSQLVNYGCFDLNAKVAILADGREILQSSPVGRRKPNDLGLFDMYGNVGEWCSEVGEHQKGERQFCGSGTGQRAIAIKSTETGSYPPKIVFNSLGFRVVRTLPTATTPPDTRRPE